MKLELALQNYLHHAKYILGHSDETLRRFNQCVTTYRKRGDVKLVSDMNEKNARELLLQGRSVYNWKSSSYITFHKTLKRFIDWCLERNLIEGENFISKIAKPKLEKSLPKALAKEDAVRLLEFIENYPSQDDLTRRRNHAIFALFIYAGLRKKEALLLKLSDIDSENLTIFIRGKGNKDRIVPMSITLASIIDKYIVERKKANKTCPELFVLRWKNRGLTVNGINNFKKIIQNESGIRFTIHGLRHTFATLMLEGGCDIYSLSKMMGHSDISTTTIYLSASSHHLRGQITKHPLNLI